MVGFSGKEKVLAFFKQLQGDVLLVNEVFKSQAEWAFDDHIDWGKFKEVVQRIEQLHRNTRCLTGYGSVEEELKTMELQEKEM